MKTSLPFGWAAVAAVVVVAVLVGSAMFGSRMLAPAATQSPSPVASEPVAVVSESPDVTASPTATETATATPSPSPSPTDAPTPAPTPTATSNAGYVCGAETKLASTRSGYEPAPVTDVRVGSHPGYDRIVFEFAGTGTPNVDVSPASPPFLTDGSGQPVTVAGSVFLRIKLVTAAGYPTYTGPTSFAPGFPRLTSLVRSGDYEGYVTWIAGLSGDGCYKVSVASGPSRVIVDVQAP